MNLHRSPVLHVAPRAARRRPTLASAILAAIVVAGCAVAATASREAEAGGVRWAWSGAVTTSAATVKARLKPPAAGARLRVTDEQGAAAGPSLLPASGVIAADAHGMVAFEITGLAPDTRYRYAVEPDRGPAMSGTFRTFGDGAFSFRVGFASCASTGSNSPVFDAIRGLAPDLFIHMGDFHYEDIATNTPDRFRQVYDRVLASPRQSAMYRAMPLVYVWDDHDFGPNDADGSSPSKPAVFEVYRQFVPHYPLPTADNRAVNQAFTIGRVRFIVTDSRSSRTPIGPAGPLGSPTMLGPVQLAWLERELRASADHALVVWVNTVPWITRRKGNTDGWQRYGRERTRIADLIAELGLSRRLVMLSGDAHMVAIDDGTNSNYATGAAAGEPAFPVMHAAPMDRRTSEKGGPYTHGISRRRGQFGLMEVTDDGTVVRVELTGRDLLGGVIPRMRLVLSCEARECRVTASGATSPRR